MANGLLLMTHGHLGESFLATYRYMSGRTDAEGVIVVSLAGTESRRIISRRALQAVATLREACSGVLILTDLRGSTPANVAEQIAAAEAAVSCVCGLNMAMLLEAMDRRHLPLPQLCKAVIAAGKKSVLKTDPSV